MGASGLQNVFGDGKAKHNMPLVTRNPRVLMTAANPEHAVFNSFDPAFITFIRAMRDQFDSTFKPDLTKEGFSRNGVHTGAERLGCVAGYMMNPMSWTAADNARYRKSLGLSKGYTKRQRQIAEEVWNIIFSEWAECDVNVPKLSTSGVRRFTHDVDWKIDFAGMVMEPSEFAAMLDAVAKKDVATLADDFEMVFMTYIQTRNQNEAISKKREVFDLEYAASGGARGHTFYADKKVVLPDGRAYEDLSATRARVIHAGPWAINCVLQVVASGHMKSLFHRFPSTFHVTTPERLKELVDGHYVYCGDVKEYDRSMSAESLEVVHTVMERYWHPSLVQMSRRLFAAPYYSKPLELSGTRGEFLGDPRDWDVSLNCGNRSGHALTSLVAKGNKVIDDLFVFDSMGMEVIGHCKEYLQADRAIKIINNGDDCVTRTEDRRLMDSFRAHRSDPLSGHYIVEEEVGQVFSGMMLVKADDNSLVYDPQRRLYTPFEKMYVPERSAGSRHRAYWPVGFHDRIITGDTYNSAGSEAWRIHNDLFRTHLEPQFGNFLGLVNTALEGLPFMFGNLTAIDKDVLEDTDRIHYKYLAEEINPEVLSLTTSKLPYDKFKHIPRDYYQGAIL